MKASSAMMLLACVVLACIGLQGAAANTKLHDTGARQLQNFGGNFPDFNAAFAQAQAAAQAASITAGGDSGGGNGCSDCNNEDSYPDYNQCQAAASAFASASASSGGRRLLGLRDAFFNAFAQANAQAGAVGFGSPTWQDHFINACAAQASASASSSSGSGRKLQNIGGKFPDFNTAFAQAAAAAQAASISGGSGGQDHNCYNCGDYYPSYNQCQAAASAFANAGSTSGGRRKLMGWRDTFSAAFAQANAQAGAAGFGSPDWQSCFINACAAQASASASASSSSGSGRKLQGVPDFSAAFANAQAAAQAATASNGNDYYDGCQAAASAFASAGSTSGGRHLLGASLQDIFSGAFAQANAQAGAASFGTPTWKNYFVNNCLAQAQSSASSFSFGCRKLKGIPNFSAAFANAQAAAQAATASNGNDYYDGCQAAASAFASAGSTSGGRHLLGASLQDIFSGAFAQANAQAGAASFGTPTWKNYFVNNCVAQAQSSASSFSFGGRK